MMISCLGELVHKRDPYDTRRACRAADILVEASVRAGPSPSTGPVSAPRNVTGRRGGGLPNESVAKLQDVIDKPDGLKRKVSQDE